MKIGIASNISNILVQPNGNPDTAGKVLHGDELIQFLELAFTNKHTIVLVHGGHYCKVFNSDLSDAPLIDVDPDKESTKALKKLAKARLLKRFELAADELNHATIVDPVWKLLDANQTDVTDLLKKREAMFGQGRGKPISESTARQVWHAAAGRCMYRGCGQDLGATPLSTKPGRIAYLAHIVASDPDGPRGDPASSHALSDDPENIMLMCDAHHRLIDRVDEAGHPPDYLREMRQEHKSMVSKMLDGLAFPRTQATLLAYSDLFEHRFWPS